jgi:hypothetical protein
VLEDAFTQSNSLKFSKFSSYDMILFCINFANHNHLDDFDSEADNAKKNKMDWKIDMLVTIISLRQLSMK